MQTGRPRAFDIDEALDKALRVFWEKGYEGASLPDLTAAMGINRPSLYAAFGNKESLFRKAIDRYQAGGAGWVCAALGETTARGAVEKLLLGNVASLTDPAKPRGCLMVHGALSCGDDSDAIRQELACRRAANEAQIRERLERAHAEGDLPASACPADLARFVATLLQGLAVQASGGATREQLEAVVRIALEGWPAGEPAEL